MPTPNAPNPHAPQHPSDGVPSPGTTHQPAPSPAPAATSAGDATTLQPPTPITESAGSRIGPYKLLQRIGEGGFGVVFMAQQDTPVRRKVALKIIKLGMDSRQVIARFEAERQALALMDHPHIARVIDGGTTESGRPYFVMEYVVGDSVIAFADAHRLDITARLDLFSQVCQAVQHAHQKGIIHRDLKPANILASMVDGKPFARVIDFGIAKATGAAGGALTDKTLFTEHRQLMGTPEYMSPEQAEGSPDIDIYALGVLLYELLTGLTPFDSARLRSAAWAEMQRIIREEEPLAPSLRLSRSLPTLAAAAQARHTDPGALTGRVRGELDWIVLKALDKDRARRYETANQFAADVQRHLSGEAVTAAPPSAAYRLRKFVKKHKVAALVMAALTNGLLATSLATALALRATQRASELTNINKQSAADAQAARDAALIARDNEAKAREEVEYNAYTANIALASADLEARRFVSLRRRLDDCAPSQRGWEWHWLNAVSDSSLYRIQGCTSSLTDNSFSTDGQTFVAGFDDGTVRFYEVGTGAEVRRFTGHTGPVLLAAYAEGGTRIVSVGTDWSARVWHSQTGHELSKHTFFTTDVRQVSMSPDAARLLVPVGPDEWRVLGTSHGDTLLDLDDVGSPAPVWVPNSDLIAVLTLNDKLCIRCVSSGECTFSVQSHAGPRGILAASKTGRVAVGDADCRSFVYDIGSRALIAELLPLPNDCEEWKGLAFDPTGQYVALYADNDILEWRIYGHNADLVFQRRETTSCTALAWNPDTGVETSEGPAKFACGLDVGSVYLTDQPGVFWNQELDLLGSRWPIVSIAFAPQNTVILVTNDQHELMCWSISTPEAPDTKQRGIAGSPIYTRSSADGVHHVRSLPGASTSLLVDTFTDPPNPAGPATHVPMDTDLDAHVTAATISPDGIRVAAATAAAPEGLGGNRLTLWDARTGTRLVDLSSGIWALNSHEEPFLGFSPDGTRLSARADGHEAIWDSIPYRIRFAQRRANERGEDGGAIVKAWLAAVNAGTEKGFVVPLK